jgi:hypothetical protein
MQGGPVVDETRSASQRSDVGEDGDKAQTGTETTSSQNKVTAGRAATGPRTATVNLPFVTAQFRAPNVHLPSRKEIGAAAQGLASFLPSPKAALYFGGLVGAAALEVIEWPVAVAIGVGAALASRGEARPGPWGGTRPVAQTPVERGTTTA